MPARMRHVRAIAVVMGATSLALAVSLPAQATTHRGTGIERAVLPAGDGWASADGSTTGGAGATPEHVYTVTDRAELIAAFEDAGDAPKIVRIAGTVHGNSDAEGTPIGCEAYQQGGYTLEKYLDAYDPAVWGRDEVPAGPLEDARAASAKLQAAAVNVNVPSNTTLVGVGKDATIIGASLQVKNVSNVIVRNISFEDTYDCFPQWDPTDGDQGAWNSEYDNLVVHGSSHVWVDHNTFSDGDRPDADQPHYFGQVYQQHDGLFDIVRGADLVTVSWNVLEDHDKTMLIGNSDGAGASDRGKLRVTLHHNLFKDVKERAPRVRFGQVDSYNNHFVATTGSAYGYTYGIGAESKLVAESNAFTLGSGLDRAKILKKWSESSLTAENNYVNGRKTDLIAVHNAGVPAEQLTEGAGWTPTLRTRVSHPLVVPLLVGLGAGAGKPLVR
ncbi:polysaccharide lyase family 1 protein [Streptomyces sp. NPDC053741]|jgi:pectate lyase|uniref:Polysaccharide lyase family 1 protein n=1 Tax=[Kitasatospora] papulosa TaxID=1464011 RepID=A0ABZ1K121_9ACTN|nr:MULTISPECIES: polysaccharide lyase family 1 protein [Streptomyces]MBD2831362.1 polysaccharide lyase family 1 protein [Streptomyces pratensis]RAS37104.1 pectate lyase [Streptomyces avidinii]TPM83881.1 polysaccharide lyase family 1 protein [Mesorhizobium sp. B2-3-3]SNX73670.1 pectate lyase [Streptomyces microflavus]MCX4413091.1 polysaccharide lyase family 1 protein [[Kitasatospora] papulosa]